MATPKPIETQVVMATPKPIETQALHIAKAKSNIDYNQAWEVINAESSWKVASERESALAQDFGITSAEHLRYLDANDIQEIAGKLKKVPARQLTTAFNLN